LTHISIIKFQLFVPLPKEVCAEKICNEVTTVARQIFRTNSFVYFLLWKPWTFSIRENAPHSS